MPYKNRILTDEQVTRIKDMRCIAAVFGVPVHILPTVNVVTGEKTPRRIPRKMKKRSQKRNGER